ncbi:hypothetical protein ACIA5H_35695 [Nocardia sp. NPDC051900]|uniref:hypothetical protein n=1 Tax=Nocardia sp. NPDC051900 TaxID=3364326 RepID=UPI00378811F9
MNRIDDSALLEDEQSYDYRLRDQESVFGREPVRSDLIVCSDDPARRPERLGPGDSTAQIVKTRGAERIFTDAVPYPRTVADPIEEVTFPPFNPDPDHVQFLQIDVYEIEEIRREADGTLHDTGEVTMGGDTGRNRSSRMLVYGTGAVRYDPVGFEKLCRMVRYLRRDNLEKDCFLVGVNVEDAPSGAADGNTFDAVLTVRWEESKVRTWPICIRTEGYCYLLVQKTSTGPVVATMKERLCALPAYTTDHKAKELCDTAVHALQVGLEAIGAYDIQSSAGKYVAELSKWSAVVGVGMVLEACGIRSLEENLFSVVQIDADARPASTQEAVRVRSIQKGDGLPRLRSKAWDHMFPRDSLVGISRSPQATANTMVAYFIVFGNELGRLVQPAGNIFFYDYAIESRSESLKEWVFGVARKVDSLFEHLPPLDATGVLCNLMNGEMVRCKARVEETARRLGFVNDRMILWKDKSAMLQYRAIDGMAGQLIPYTMWTNDETEVIGFLALLNDVFDFAYDISVKEPSNLFLTLTDGKIDDDSVKNAYVRFGNGLQYIIERYKYDAPGLSVLATCFWQLSNGRHRIIPSIYNGTLEYEHRYVDLDPGKGLVHMLENSDGLPGKSSLGRTEYGKLIRDNAAPLGVDAIALAKLITVDIENAYFREAEFSESHVLKLEQQLCELITSCALGCDPADTRMTDFLWMLLEYMFLKSGMYLSAAMGALKIMHNRRQADDRGGLAYAPW